MLRIGAAIIVFLCMIGSSAFAQENQPKKTPECRALRKITPTELVRELLQEEIAIPEQFHQTPGAPLALVLKYFCDTILHRTKTELPIFVDQASFEVGPKILETEVTFPATIPKMPLQLALEIAVGQIARRGGAIVVRDGRVDIVSKADAAIGRLLEQKVELDIRNRPLKHAVEELSDLTGIRVMIDPRCGAELTRPVALCTRKDITARGILASWADIHDLWLVVDEHRVMLTPRADYVRKLRDEAELAALAAEIRQLQPRESSVNRPQIERQRSVNELPSR